MTLASLFLGLALLAPVAAASDDDTHGASDAADAHAEEADDRSGDATVFSELFSHLVPHPVTALWFGGEGFVQVVPPYEADAEGKPLHGDEHHPEMFHSSAELNAHYADAMGGGYGLIIYNINTVMWIAGLLLFVVFVPMRRKAQALAGEVPRGGTFYGMLEPVVLFVRDDMVYAIMGKHHGKAFVPLFLTMFFFILFMNLLGLVNLGSVGGTATANLAVTAGLALVTFLYIHMAGLKEHGPITHWKNFIPHGIPWFAVPIIAVVEAVGLIVKPCALTVRLFANMTAGHLIVLGLFGLIVFFGNWLLFAPIFGMSVGIYALELFVCFVQAYVFTYLSILFIGAAVHPEH